MNMIQKHWRRLCRSLTRRYREWRLPHGYVRLGTRYGGWWIDQSLLSAKPLLVDCGLGEDISFPLAFLKRFGGQVVAVEPNPRSLAYCHAHCPSDMEVLALAFWKRSGESITFHLPRNQDKLPEGADGVSGSVISTHEYVGGGEQLTVATIAFMDLLARFNRAECDVLKLDIEGAEFEVLAELCRTGDIRRTRQLLTEFHHQVTHHTVEDTTTIITKLGACGFELVHVEGRNHIFRRAATKQ